MTSKKRFFAVVRGLTTYTLSILTFYLASCSDCTTCEPFLEEPVLKVQFLNTADSSERIVTIDSINQAPSADIRQFIETSFEYQFPLDMHSDTSVYDLVYRENDDTVTIYRNRIMLTYSREFLKRDDNYIIIKANLSSFESDFLLDKLSCKDSTNIECISNEATARVYN